MPGLTCPVYPGTRYRDWNLADPADLPVEEVRLIRDQIRTKVEKLFTGLGIAPTGLSG